MSKSLLDGFKFQVTDEDRKRLKPEELKILEKLYERLRNNEHEEATAWNADKFNAEWMHPVGEPIPDWHNKKGRERSTADDAGRARNGVSKKSKP